MIEAGQFYTNRVLKDWKEKSKMHVEWTKAWLATLAVLQAFVKEHHTTGLIWNSNPGAGNVSKSYNPGLFDWREGRRKPLLYSKNKANFWRESCEEILSLKKSLKCRWCITYLNLCWSNLTLE